MFYSLIIFFIFNFYNLTYDPDKIIKAVISKFNQVEDYQVDVKIKVDIDFLKVPESKAKLYFKQPDKVKLISEGFAMLPKDGINFSPASFIKGNYTAIFERTEIFEGVQSYVLKIIPINKNTNIVLSTIWIDAKKYIIKKVESTTKTQGTFTLELFYDDKFEYPLPSQMIFSFNLEKMNIPGQFLSKNFKKDGGKIKDGPIIGRVIVNYNNYVINKNLSDNIFIEENNSKNK